MRTYELPKKLTLDVKTWRCGGEGPNKHGAGETCLLNDAGFTCCLGQFSLQAGVPREALRRIAGPGRAADNQHLVTGLAYLANLDSLPAMPITSPFSINAMCINDNRLTTVDEKITLLITLCAENGYELEIINKESVCPQT